MIVKAVCGVFLLATFGKLQQPLSVYVAGSHALRSSCRCCRHRSELSASNIDRKLRSGATLSRDRCLRSVPQHQPFGHTARGVQGVVRPSTVPLLISGVADRDRRRETRRRVRKILVVGPSSSQIQKIFALFIESGVLYSALWVSILRLAATSWMNEG